MIFNPWHGCWLSILWKFAWKFSPFSTYSFNSSATKTSQTYSKTRTGIFLIRTCSSHESDYLHHGYDIIFCFVFLDVCGRLIQYCSSKETSSEDVAGRFPAGHLFGPHCLGMNSIWLVLALGNWADELEDMPVACTSPCLLSLSPRLTSFSFVR